MKRTVRGVLALALFVVLLGLNALHAQDDEMVENPKYKLWSNFKPGMFSRYTETTKFGGKEGTPNVDEKIITYRLDTVNDKRVIVTTSVIEQEIFGQVESAPTRLHYPAKMKKATLEGAMAEFGAKHSDDETVKVNDKEIKCKVVGGTYKKDGATVEFKLYYSDEVPGGIVKRTRTTKDGDKLVADTVILLRAFGEAPKKKEKKED